MSVVSVTLHRSFTPSVKVQGLRWWSESSSSGVIDPSYIGSDVYKVGTEAHPRGHGHFVCVGVCPFVS